MPTPALSRIKSWSRLTVTWGLLAIGGTLSSATERAQGRQVERSAMSELPVVVRSEGRRPVMAWSLHGPRVFLGVQMISLTPELRRHFGAPEDAGVMVSRVSDDSPASEAGVLVGDIVAAVDGERVASPSELALAVGERESGDAVDLEIWRQGRVLSLSATLAEREGRWVDIRQFQLPHEHLRAFDWTEGELEGAIELDTETLNRAIERLNEKIASPEWRERLQHFREHQDVLLERLETLERRLKEMEKQLDKLPPED